MAESKIGKAQKMEQQRNNGTTARDGDEDDDDESDVISKAIGEFGRWQLQLTFVISLFNVPCTWHIFVPTFQGAERDFWCARPKNLSDIEPSLWRNVTQPNGHCTVLDYNTVVYATDNIANISGMPKDRLINCTGWEFSGVGETLISEFSLLCDRKGLLSLAEMMFLGGVAIGGLVCGAVSDRYGRKRTLILSVFIQSLLGTCIAFAPWFELYYVLRAAAGFISISVVFSAFVLTIELVGGRWRTVSGVCYMFPVSLGYITGTGIAYLLRDWRQLQLAVSLPGFLFVGLWWILPESPRWLLAMGHKKEVIKILKEAALVNNIQLPDNIDKQLQPSLDGDGPRLGMLDLFRIKRLRYYTAYLLVIWFSVYLVYYGLVLNLGNIGGDLYINSILNGVVELPALAVSILILLRMGRRLPLSLTMIFAGIFCLTTLTVPYLIVNGQWLTTTFTMIGKLLITASNAIMPIFTAELYPTTLRNVGVGINNVLAGVALMLVPYLWNLESINGMLPMSVLGLFGLIGGSCVLFLPETSNKPLDDNVHVGNKNEISSSSLEDNYLHM